jgi:hypothetical protein
MTEWFSHIGPKCRCGRTTRRERKGAQGRCWQCGNIPKSCECLPLAEGRTIQIPEAVYDSAEFAAQFTGMTADEWIAWITLEEARRVRDKIDSASPFNLIFPEESPAKRPVSLSRARLRRGIPPPR